MLELSKEVADKGENVTFKYYLVILKSWNRFSIIPNRLVYKICDKYRTTRRVAACSQALALKNKALGNCRYKVLFCHLQPPYHKGISKLEQDRKLRTKQFGNDVVQCVSFVGQEAAFWYI